MCMSHMCSIVHFVMWCRDARVVMISLCCAGHVPMLVSCKLNCCEVALGDGMLAQCLCCVVFVLWMFVCVVLMLL